jgi:hypothetical protein
MEIDKSIGQWVIDKDREFCKVTYIDDLAYHIYCQPRKNRQKDNIQNQVGFLMHPKVYRRFYDMAESTIRREKINKIMNNGSR